MHKHSKKKEEGLGCSAVTHTDPKDMKSKQDREQETVEDRNLHITR